MTCYWKPLRHGLRLAGFYRAARNQVQKYLALGAAKCSQARTRPPKNGISAWLSACGLFDVNIISAPAESDSFPGGPSRSDTRRAIAGAGSIQPTGHGARRTKRSSNKG